MLVNDEKRIERNNRRKSMKHFIEVVNAFPTTKN